MMVVGIDDVGAEDQETRRDLVVGEMAARAEQLQPAVIVDEVLAEIGGGVGLAPAQLVATLAPADSTSGCSRRRRDLGGAVEMARGRQARCGSSARCRHGPVDPGRRSRAPAHRRADSRKARNAASSSATDCRHCLARSPRRPVRQKVGLRGRIIGLDCRRARQKRRHGRTPWTPPSMRAPASSN